MTCTHNRLVAGALARSMLFYVLILSTFGVLVSGTSSRADWDFEISGGMRHDVDSLSSLLLARGGSESKVLVKAKQLIRDLSSSTTCAHAPIARLLRQCKEIKPKHEDSHSEYQLNNAESVYAISMALCEAYQARVTAPSACQIFENMLERPLPDMSVEIIRSSDIEACSAVLYDTPGWTSYSTYKSNARLLCDSSRTDYQREELLQTLRDATEVIPEILDVLDEHRTEANVAMVQLRESAAHVESTQLEILLHAQEQEKAQAARLAEVIEYVEAIQTTMGDALTENSRILDLNVDKARIVEQKLTEVYASFIEAASGITFDLNEQIGTLSEQTTSMLAQIRDLGTQDNLDKLQATIHAVSESAADLARLQTVQIETSREVLEVFHSFKPEQLLPAWLRDFSTGILSFTLLLRSEGPLVIVFATPMFWLFIFGRFRFSFCTIAAYFFCRSLCSYATATHQFLSYMVHQLIPRFPRIEYRVFSAFVLHHYTQLATCCLLAALTICFCANTRRPQICTVGQQPSTVVKFIEKKTKSSVKEHFERSRRACSVPLDCECA